MNILHGLSFEKGFLILDKQNYYERLSQTENHRMSKVIGYVVENFQDFMSLKQAAYINDMTPHAFGKYFKKGCQQNFFGSREGLSDRVFSKASCSYR